MSVELYDDGFPCPSDCCGEDSSQVPYAHCHDDNWTALIHDCKVDGHCSQCNDEDDCECLERKD